MSDIKIDDSYFASATLSPLSNVSGVVNDCKKIVLVDIKLADDPKKLFWIRGNNIPQVTHSKNLTNNWPSANTVSWGNLLVTIFAKLP